MRVKDAVGQFGENAAVDHLVHQGFVVLERNWRCRGGEVDIVARDGAALVFVEVKTRSSHAYGGPADAVDRRKAARIRRLAVQWMAARRDAGDPTFWESVRFDVVSVVRQQRGPKPLITHLVGAF